VARSALECGHIDEAKVNIEKALKIDAKSRDARILRGIAALIEKKYEAAEADFEAAVEQLPNSYAARNNLALALCGQNNDGKKKRALELADRNCQDYPDDPEAAATCGWVLYRLGRLEEAARVFRPLADKKHLSLDARYYMACVANDRGQIDEAVHLLARIAVGGEPFCMRPEAEALMKDVAAKWRSQEHH
jgi:tetratricopeptide (TPR) repeat protein